MNLQAAVTSPFHAGEQAVQTRLGVRERIEPWARQVIRSFLTEQHREFFTEAPFLVGAARDAKGRPWVTLLVGAEAFVRSPDPQALRIQTQPLIGDALEGALGIGAELGLLGIELETRRRNRVNGRILASDDSGLQFHVGQSFGNCPQHIHQRKLRRVSRSGKPVQAERSIELTDSQRAWIEQADTLFIASGCSGDSEDAAFGMDASHRGGHAGFVRVESSTRLIFPDYAGNNHFNTVGNIMVDARIGLLFVDFVTGSLLQMTGTAIIDWDSSELARHPGAQRLIVFTLEEVVELRGAVPLRWSSLEEAALSVELIEKKRESDDVVSFTFVARNGRQLPKFEAGQHLPIDLVVPGQKAPIARTYSLSNAPDGNTYRISVKREPQGLASRYLQDEFSVGERVTAFPPSGDFVLQETDRPVVLLSAGIGITPMVSMLHARLNRPPGATTWFIHGARDGAHQPLIEEVRSLVNGKSNVRSVIACSQPRSQDVLGRDYDVQGRLDGELLARNLPGLDADFYLCGPIAFLADLQKDLSARGVPEDRIHTETFGGD